MIDTTQLYIYLLEQDTSKYHSYATYYSCCIVVATSEGIAKSIHPSGDNDAFSYESGWPDLDNLDLITVTEVGLANDDQTAGTILCADYSRE